MNTTRIVGHREVLFRANGNRVFRMEFSADCNASGNEPLVFHQFANNDQICRAIDLNVTVRGTAEGFIPTSLLGLTPDEVAQIPLKDRP